MIALIILIKFKIAAEKMLRFFKADKNIPHSIAENPLAYFDNMCIIHTDFALYETRGEAAF